MVNSDEIRIGGFHKFGGYLHSWLVYEAKSYLEMDELGYPYLRTSSSGHGSKLGRPNHKMGNVKHRRNLWFQTASFLTHTHSEVSQNGGIPNPWDPWVSIPNWSSFG